MSLYPWFHSETWSNHKVPDQACKEGRHPSHVFNDQKFSLLRSSVSSWGTHFTEICCIFRFSLRIYWNILLKGTQLPEISAMVLLQCLLKILRTFFHVFVLFSLSGGMMCKLKIFPYFNSKATKKIVFFPWCRHWNLLWALIIFWCSFISLNN